MSSQRYVIKKSIGAGLTGEVFEAEDTMLKRSVAIRKIKFADEPDNREEFEETFFSVTSGLCGLSHPSICTVFDGGLDEDGAFIVYQLLKGESMKSRLMRGPVHEWNVFQAVESLLESLSSASAVGFHHGAINPTSLLRVPRASGGYRHILLDLGLNKLVAPLYGKESEGRSFAEPLMMAPEQFEGAPVSEQTDIYMVGQFAYIFLIGGHPYSGMSPEELVEMHKTTDLQKLTDYDIVFNEDYSNWVHSLIEIDPKNRPQSLKEALSSMPIVHKPMSVHTMPVSMKASPGGGLNGMPALPSIPPTQEEAASQLASNPLNAPIQLQVNPGPAKPLLTPGRRR